MKSNAVQFLAASALSAVILFAYVSLAQPKEGATITQCASNIKQLSEALRSYAVDNGAYPANLEKLRGVYIKDPRILVCDHKFSTERQSVRLIRAGILSLLAGVLVLLLRHVSQNRKVNLISAVVLAVAFFVPSEVRRDSPTAVDYTYAPPAGPGLLPRLQDNPGNHGPHAINTLAPNGAVVPVGPNAPTSPY